MSRLRSWLAPVAVFAAGFFFFHRHEILSGWDAMPGDRGDPRLFGFLLEHLYLVLRGAGAALSPPMFYPVRETLGYSHALIGYLPLYAPWRLFGVDPWSSQQLAVALADVLNFASALWLLQAVMRVERKLALFFAAFITFNSAKFNQVGHEQLQLLFYLIIAFGLVVRAMQEAPARSRAWVFGMLAAAALCVDLQFLTDVYHAWFLCFWAVLWGLVMLIRAESRGVLVRGGRAIAVPLAGALVVMALGMVPLVRIYLPIQHLFGGWEYVTVVDMLPRWYSFITMGDGNWLWHWLPVPRDSPNWGELHVGLGFAIYAVTIVVLVRSRTIPSVARSCLFATLLFIAIALRYTDSKSPWHLVYVLMPGAQSLRAIGRYMIVLTIPLAIGLGVALTDRMPAWSVRMRRTIWVLLVIAAIEQLGSAQGFSKSRERALIEGLRPQLTERCTAFYAATPAAPAATEAQRLITGLLAQGDAMWLAILSGVPTVNGYSGHFPPGWDLVWTSAADYPAHITRWSDLQGIQGTMCRVEVPE